MDKSETVDPWDKHALAVKRQAREADLAVFKELTLETLDQEQWAADKIKALSEYVKELEVERKALKAPLLSDIDALDGAFRGSRAPAEQGIELLKSKLADAARRRMLANEAAVQGAQALALSGASEAAQEALSTIQEPAQLSGASTQEAWFFEVQDPDLVPDRYKVVSAELLQAEITFATKKGVKPLEVPGVRFFKDIKVRRTRGKRAGYATGA